MTWSVVIPSARASNLVRSVGALLQAHPGLDPSRIVVVDDGARAEAERLLPSGIQWVEGAKPFVWSRNVNRGIAVTTGDPMLIMGDDVEVLTEGAFDRLAAVLEEIPELGALSTAVEGVVGNPRQHWMPTGGLQIEGSWLAFVCVMLSRAAWEAAGPLDEAFDGYGCDDVDYSWRLRERGFRLGVLHSTVVRHDGSIPSTFRSAPDVVERWKENCRKLEAKWTGLRSSQD